MELARNQRIDDKGLAVVDDLGRALLYQRFMRGFDLMRWETEGGRLANHETEGQRLMNTPTSIPVIAVSHAPRRAADAWKFAQGIRTRAETFQVTGVVVVSTHWNRPGESVTVGLEVDDTRGSAAEGRELVERLRELLESAGLTPELNGGLAGDTMAWRPIVEALSDSEVPLVHVSVPVRFGDDLMRLAAVALRRLRHERILLIGFSDVFGDALLAEDVSFDRRQYVAEGVPV